MQRYKADPFRVKSITDVPSTLWESTGAESATTEFRRIEPYVPRVKSEDVGAGDSSAPADVATIAFAMLGVQSMCLYAKAMEIRRDPVKGPRAIMEVYVQGGMF